MKNALTPRSPAWSGRNHRSRRSCLPLHRKLVPRRWAIAVERGGSRLLVSRRAKAKVSGLTPGGGTPPFPLPLGALDFLDRKSYIRNMEMHAFLPGSTISGGEPLMAVGQRQAAIAARPRKAERWTVPHCNAGWDDRTPRSVYFSRGLRNG